MNSRNEGNVSIIIPIYKTDKQFLDRCISSILTQDYEKFEVLLVDDGNPWEYGRMLDEYAEKDRRIIVIHKNNGGASSARNAGLSKSCGDYIVFVDSDDIIPDNFLSSAVHYLESYNLDIAMGGYSVDGILHIPDCEAVKIYDREQIKYLKEFFVTGLSTEHTKELRNCQGVVAPWAKIFRRNRIIDIQFDETLILSEDTLYNLYCMEQVERIGIIPECWYNYFVVENSICHRYRENALNEINNSSLKFAEYVKSSSEGKDFFEEAYRYRMLWQLNSLLLYYYCNKEYDKKQPVKGIKTFLKNNDFPKTKPAKNVYISKGFKILRYLCAHRCAIGIYYFYKFKMFIKEHK